MNAQHSEFMISPRASLRDALIQMTSTHKGVLLVANDNLQLLGILSDGDIRRALLKGVSLEILVEQVMNLNPICASSLEAAKNKLGQKPELFLVPIIKKDGIIQGIYSNLTNQTGFFATQIDDDSSLFNNSRSPIRVVAIIPARGGSRRIPQKNLAKVGNDSLLGLAIKTAQASQYIDHIIVSTDDPKIASEAEKYDVKIPWLRPEKLATDTSKTIDVVLHAVNKFEEGYNYLPEIGVLLEPTAPLRTTSLIDKSLQAYDSNKVDSLVSVNELRHNFHPEELLKIDKNGLISPFLKNRTMDSRKLRGEQDKLYVQNGLVYVFSLKMLITQKSLYGNRILSFETPADNFLDVDTYEDLKLAQLKISQS